MITALLLANLAIAVYGATKLNDECRIERIKEYDPIDGNPTPYEDDFNREFWQDSGFDVASDDAWIKFKGSEKSADAICAHRDINKPFCISYNDPDDPFEFQGVTAYREKKICAECRPEFLEYDTHSCDCGYNEYCTSQFIIWGEENQLKEPEDGDIRLVDSHRVCEGRLEIFHENEWGSICDDSFDIREAEIVCKNLGYENVVNSSHHIGNAEFGEGTGRIWLDDMECFGNESRIVECMTDPWGDHNCNHREDVSVACGYCHSDWDEDSLKLLEAESQPRERKINLMQSLTEREHKWTSEHGTCKRIPKDKLNKKCARSLTGIIGSQEDMDIFMGENLWCGSLDGWEGYCYDGECHECRALHISEFTEDDVRCANEKGSPRWCTNEGTFTKSVPVPPIEKETLENDKTELVLIAITMALMICILGVLCYGIICKTPRMSKNGMVRQIDHAEMTSPP